jgi:hypothetical protein
MAACECPAKLRKNKAEIAMNRLKMQEELVTDSRLAAYP